jgi:hypothetical protein
MIAWGLVGIAATFADAIARLSARAQLELRGGLAPWHWLALVLLVIALGYLEGVRALQRRFVPSVIARATELPVQPSAAYRLAAPLYVVSLIGAPRRARVHAGLGVAAIIACVVAVRQLPAPWRGIVDAAVAVALGWGLGALIVAACRTWRSAWSRRNGRATEVA